MDGELGHVLAEFSLPRSGLLFPCSRIAFVLFLCPLRAVNAVFLTEVEPYFLGLDFQTSSERPFQQGQARFSKKLSSSRKQMAKCPPGFGNQLASESVTNPLECFDLGGAEQKENEYLLTHLMTACLMNL